MIRERADTHLQGDDAILLYVQAVLRRQDKQAVEQAEIKARRNARVKRVCVSKVGGSSRPYKSTILGRRKRSALSPSSEGLR